MKSYTLAQLCEQLGGELKGDGQVAIHSVATLEQGQAGQIAFLANRKYQAQLQSTKAAAVLLSPGDAEDFNGNAIILKDPYVAFARVAQLLDTTPAAATDIHPSAVVDPSAKLGEGVALGPNVVIGANVTLGDRVQIGAGTVIGQDCQIGADTRLWANVTIYHNVHLGERCIIHSGTILGADGFGYANERGHWIKIPQTGGVRIGNDVEIGASTTVDRGAIDHTIIKDGVIIDNQVQIAHNDIIGEHTAIAGCTTLAGSVTIGKHCIIGGMVAINGHMEICDGVHLTGRTMVMSSIKEPGVYSAGTPHMTNKDWRKNAARFRQLDGLFSRVKQLEKAEKRREDEND
ncbi:UDP-3-O-(3-hydroxymyristoyl)glucosamine N-acyltransferase [Paraferrimonas sedimenticola]|uniref:UDP-3-O-acylglucosamine N-acyltransferase n=1 Tax=Paraferrimonas sedimenticola TaxID=375674 RepID=A0AA37RY03_9GAMM|nr:UDP-3-O-(3-hydroxymyristoyl)glucosamine N-acyltransferase [Paraferrimonas sedimenticola]GLP96712.1 UDP-3-O-acylglucosamine N-acyltransferase [Paraferrimonas sedimenticola]